MKLTEKKLKYLIKDEHKATREYRKLGLPTLSRDEAKHRRILTRKLKRLEKKEHGKNKKKN